jgi:hypothetical protein
MRPVGHACLLAKLLFVGPSPESPRGATGQGCPDPAQATNQPPAIPSWFALACYGNRARALTQLFKGNRSGCHMSYLPQGSPTARCRHPLVRSALCADDKDTGSSEGEEEEWQGTLGPGQQLRLADRMIDGEEDCQAQRPLLVAALFARACSRIASRPPAVQQQHADEWLMHGMATGLRWNLPGTCCGTCCRTYWVPAEVPAAVPAVIPAVIPAVVATGIPAVVPAMVPIG